MSTLTVYEFVKKWNGEVEKLRNPDLVVSWILEYLKDEMKSVLGVEEPRGWSASQLGYPGIQQALTYLGYNFRKYTLQTAYHLLIGHLMELVFIGLASEYGCDIVDCQQEITVDSDSNLLGHIDGIDNTTGVLLEIKTMSGFLTKPFAEMPNDDYGYVTQALVYQRAKQTTGAAIVTIDKATGAATYIPLTDDSLEYPIKDYLDRADEIIDCMGDVTDIDSAFDIFSIPALNNVRGKMQMAGTLRFNELGRILYLHDAKGNPIAPRKKSDVLKLLREFGKG